MNGDKTVQLNETAMSGPEFLQAFADQNAANGLDVNADVFRTRAEEWKQLEQAYTRLANAHASTTAQLEDLRARVKALDS